MQLGYTLSRYVDPRHKRLYLAPFLRAGFTPVQLYPPQAGGPSSLEGLGGLLLFGGGDVDPALYDEPKRAAQSVDRKRDDLEVEWVKCAAAQAIPVLGICRGHQLINVALGGSLHQDIQWDLPGVKVRHTYPISEAPSARHMVTFFGDAHIPRWVGFHSKWTNTHHHQALKKVAPELMVVGESGDRVAEALEHPELPIYGVQWHPELAPNPDLEPVLRGFICLLRETAGGY